ncbi:MAG: hypothetical protein V1753_07815 [Pseudomonadota bacterium]
MTKKIVLIAGLVVVLCVGRMPTAWGEDHQAHNHSHHKESHEAHHGGSLNAIDKCEIAHVEVKVVNNVIRCWFVSGGHDTDKAVRIPDKEIRLSVILKDSTKKELILQPKPIELAEEKVGDCSYFEAQADWLSFQKEFKAFGKATVKGKMRDINIQYPEGYDPDH